MTEIGEGRAWTAPVRPAPLLLDAQRHTSHVWTFFAILAALASAHVALGANPLTVAVVVSSVLVGVYALARYGVMNIAAILVFLVAFRYVGFSFVAVLFMWQPVDYSMRQPFAAFLLVLVGMAGYLLALAIAARIRVGRPILDPVLDGGRLGFISVWAAMLGVVANVAAVRAQGSEVGVSVALFFVPLLNVALITATAAALSRSRGRRAWDAWVIFLAVLALAFALMLNSRMSVMVTVLSFLVTVVAFRGRATAKQALALVAVVFIIVVVLTPIMLSVRPGREALSPYQRIERSIGGGFHWDSTAKRYQAWRKAQINSFGLLFYGTSNNALERLSLVNSVDLLKSAVDATSRVGFGDLREAAARVVPRFIVADKPAGYGHGYWLYRQVGISDSGPYPVTPLIGTGYAALGWAGAFAYPLVFGLASFIVLKKVSGWTLRSNIWAVYFLVTFQNNFVEGTTDAALTSVLRNIPQDLVVLLVLVILSRISSQTLRGNAVAPR